MWGLTFPSPSRGNNSTIHASPKRRLWILVSQVSAFPSFVSFLHSSCLPLHLLLKRFLLSFAVPSFDCGLFISHLESSQRSYFSTQHPKYSTTLCCVCSLSVRGSLSSGREANVTHTHTHTRWEPLAWPFPPLPSLYQHSHTNKLICTGAPSNRLLSFVAHMPASAHARCAHTLISTTRPLSSPLQTWHNLRHKFYYFKKGHGQFSYFAVPERSFMATG